MDRLEYVRTKVDTILQGMNDNVARKFAYIHLYGVSQTASLLAIKRGLDEELCAIMGMLHDIGLYQDSIHHNHAERSSQIAKDLLKYTNLFSEEEMDIIKEAIFHHSDKGAVHTLYAEVLKDSDVLAHYLYNSKHLLAPTHQRRLFYVLEELNVK